MNPDDRAIHVEGLAFEIPQRAVEPMLWGSPMLARGPSILIRAAC